MNPNDWHDLNESAARGIQGDLSNLMMAFVIFNVLFFVVSTICKWTRYQEQRNTAEREQERAEAEKEWKRFQQEQAAAEAEFNSWTIDGQLDAMEQAIVTPLGQGAACNDTEANL